MRNQGQTSGAGGACVAQRVRPGRNGHRAGARPAVIRSGELRARVGELELCYETFGAPDAPPVLLIMGLGSQMVVWEDGFCERLAARGFRVTRFDNRDVGRSTILDERPVPTMLQLILRDPRAAAYTLEEMADDAAGLLEVLDTEAAHVVGISMGGMIAQLLAIRHPERVRSLVSIMSTTGNRRVGQPHPFMVRRLLTRRPIDREGYVRSFITTYQQLGSRRYPPGDERTRAIAERCFERGIHPRGAARQLMAITSARDRTADLAALEVPTTVIHGTADRLVMPSGGRATAAAIAGARLVEIAGMGHDVPPVLWDQIVEAIGATAARSQI